MTSSKFGAESQPTSVNVDTDTASDIERIVQHVYRKEIPFSHSGDTVVVEKMHQNVEIVYSSRQTSAAPSDPTVIKLRLRLEVREMWIGDLHISMPFRTSGLGRQLVAAAEEVARATGMGTVNVFPLRAAWDFWLKMGYRPHHCMARVLSKSVDPHPCPQTLDVANSLPSKREVGNTE